MDLRRLTAQMEHHAQAIRALARGASERQARWRPESEAWSVLDVINHMAYEDEHDFRDRLDLCLHRPHEAWNLGESARGVTQSSRQRELEQAMKLFTKAREASLAWLKALESPDWDAVCEAPFGRMRAGDVMAAWVAHDLLHVRQLTELRWALLAREVEPYRVRYAGDW